MSYESMRLYPRNTTRSCGRCLAKCLLFFMKKNREKLGEEEGKRAALSLSLFLSDAQKHAPIEEKKAVRALCDGTVEILRCRSPARARSRRAISKGNDAGTLSFLRGIPPHPGTTMLYSRERERARRSRPKEAVRSRRKGLHSIRPSDQSVVARSWRCNNAVIDYTVL